MTTQDLTKPLLPKEPKTRNRIVRDRIRAKLKTLEHGFAISMDQRREVYVTLSMVFKILDEEL